MTGDVFDIYEAMNADKPFKVYKKVILGKVYLRVLDPFENEEVGIHLKGNPSKNDEGCFFKTYSPKEDAFLKRRNTEHFKNGTIIEVKPEVVKEKKKEKQYSDYTEEEVEKIANSKFFALESTLNDAESEAFVYRILEKARELERPEKTIKAIEARLSELQSWEVSDADTENN